MKWRSLCKVYHKTPTSVKIEDSDMLLKGLSMLKLKKALNEVKELSNCWNQRLVIFCEKMILVRSQFYVWLYIGQIIWLILVVDYILKKSEDIIKELKKSIQYKLGGNNSKR